MHDTLKRRKSRKIRSFLLTAIVLVGPIVIEISNAMSGGWVNDDGKFSVSTGKLITILLGVAYLAAVLYLKWRERSDQKDIDTLEDQLSNANREAANCKAVLNEISSALDYSRENLKKQSEHLSKKIDTEIRELEIVNFATTACAAYYRSLSNYLNSEQFTVNIYHKYKKGTEMWYQTMVAHEGHLTNPKYFGTERMLKSNKGAYYCDRILISNNPEIHILLDPDEVAKNFRKDPGSCKYKQYISIPIMDDHGSMKLMVEINVIEKCILPQNKNAVLHIITELFTPINNYLKLMVSLEAYAHCVDTKIRKEANEYGTAS